MEEGEREARKSWATGTDENKPPSLEKPLRGSFEFQTEDHFHLARPPPAPPPSLSRLPLLLPRAFITFSVAPLILSVARWLAETESRFLGMTDGPPGSGPARSSVTSPAGCVKRRKRRKRRGD